MKVKLHYLLMGVVLGLLSACSDNNDDPVVIDRTVLVYIMGDNSLSSFVSDDIAEITKGVANVDLSRNNLLLYIDNGVTVKLVRIIKDKKGSVNQEIVQTYAANRNSVGLNEMKEVFSLVSEEYPANSYGLVLWSHGEGWKPGSSPSSRWIGQDLDGNATLSISTLNEVLDAFSHYEYILFDACFMQAVEVAYELRHHADYFVGSPAEIPGPGAPYQVVVPALFAKSDAGIAVARSYFEYYNERYDTGDNNSNTSWTGGVAISAIAANKLEPLVKSTEAVVATLPKSGEVPLTGVLDYDTRSGLSRIGYYDMGQFVKKIANDDSLYNTWLNAFKAAVPYAQATDEIYSMYAGMFSISGFSGVSMFVPRTSTSNLNTSYRIMEWYDTVGWKNIGW